MNCVVNNRGSMVDCMMDTVSTESCERSSWPASHKGDKSNQSKDLHDVVVWKNPKRMIPMFSALIPPHV